jgi:hypothetical protein
VTKEIDFAILAPVPRVHLDEGLNIASTEEFVAYATDSAQVLKLFKEIDAKRDRKPVQMWIYASLNGSPDNGIYTVSWFGWYVGHNESGSGQCPDDPTHRPSTTDDDNLGHCKAFWHISGLRELQPDECIPIDQFKKASGGSRKNAPPRRPALVRL